MLLLLAIAPHSSVPPILATSAIFDQKFSPSKDNFLARVQVRTDTKANATFCTTEKLAPMADTANCSVSTYDSASKRMLSICRTKLSPHPPCFLEVRSTYNGKLEHRVGLEGPGVHDKQWELAVFEPSAARGDGSLLLFSADALGGVARIDVRTGAAAWVLPMPPNATKNLATCMPSASYDATRRVFSLIVQPHQPPLRDDEASPTPDELASFTAPESLRSTRREIRWPASRSPFSAGHGGSRVPPTASVAAMAATAVAPSGFAVFSLSLTTNTSWLTPITGNLSVLGRGVFNAVYTAPSSLLALGAEGWDPAMASSVLLRINTTSGQATQLPETTPKLTGVPPLVSIAHDEPSGAAVLRMDPHMNQQTWEPIGNPKLFVLDSASGVLRAHCEVARSLSYGTGLLLAV